MKYISMRDFYDEFLHEGYGVENLSNATNNKQ